MKRQLHLSAFLLLLTIGANAQYDLTITYNSNSGVSNLQTATKVYMHSGGNDMAGPLDTTCWNYTVGNWGVDDGIGEMVSLAGTTWTITIDPVPYYSTASNGPVTGPEIQRMALIFRDETGTLTGFGDDGNTIYLDLSTGVAEPYNSDGSPFFGITTGISAGVNSLSSNKLGISNAPNPLSTNTIFTYKVVGNSNINLSIFDNSGRLVNTLINEEQTIGTHYYNWVGDDKNGNLLSSGIYFYSLSSNTENIKGKLIIVR
jgi:hypothetical protein